MKFPGRFISMAGGLAFLLGLLHCEHPMDPSAKAPLWPNRMKIAVKPVFIAKTFPVDTLFCDSTVTVNTSTCSLYYQIRVERDSASWDPEELAAPSLFRITRKFGTEKEQAVAWIKEHFTQDSVTFMGPDGKPQLISGDNFGVAYSRPNVIDLGDAVFEVVAFTRLALSANADTILSGVSGEPAQFLLTNLAAGQSPKLAINGGEASTANSVVEVTGVFDTARVDAILFVRYSAIFPLDNFDSLFNAVLNPSDSDYIVDSYRTGPRLTEIVYYSALHTGNFFDSLYHIPGTSRYGFVKKDLLWGGPGQKWVAMRFLRSSGATLIGKDLLDDIGIAPYSGKVELDLKRASALVKRVGLENKICLLSNEVPVSFSTFGDTTFDDTVSFWLATRKLSAKFFPAVNKTVSPGIQAIPDAYRWPDAIFETLPEDFTLSSVGTIEADLLKNFDYKTGYRVSPLASCSLKAGANPALKDSFLIDAGREITAKRSDSLSLELSLMVGRGSLLGYSEDSVDLFRAQSIFKNTLSELISNAVGWHTARSFPDYLSDPGIKTKNQYYQSIAAGFSLDIQGKLYQHEFRGLPVTSGTVSEGTKEFIIIALARGKFFKEPRVFVSKYSNDVSLVWDKIPPQFSWSIDRNGTSQYNPAVHSEYAPMCYQHPSDPGLDRCTDLSALGGSMDIYLSPLPDFEKRTSFRDAGFGRITSARLLFNYHDEFLGNDPVTGERRYITESRYVDVPQEKINEQRLAPWAGTSGGTSYAITDVVFRNIDISGWASGTWDMWVETEDSFGNRGLAPYGDAINFSNGATPVRPLEKR